jgi:hypothetical protein
VSGGTHHRPNTNASDDRGAMNYLWMMAGFME